MTANFPWLSDAMNTGMQSGTGGGFNGTHANPHPSALLPCGLCHRCRRMPEFIFAEWEYH